MTRSRLLAAAAVTALAVSGCSLNSPDPNQLGVRRVGLALAYSDESLRVKVPPVVIVKYVPAPPSAILAQVPSAAPYLPPGDTTPPPTQVQPSCPKAPPGTRPSDAADVGITRPPTAGTYLQHNVGTIKVGNLSFPYPAQTQVVIRDVKSGYVTDSSGTKTFETTFTFEDDVLPTYRIVSHYEYDTKQLNLVSRSIVSGKTTTTFAPAPPVEVLAFTGPGTTYDGEGVDTNTFTTMVVQGTISAPQPVDVCGHVVDTQHVSTQENEVDVADGTQSGTPNGKPNVTNWALQLGGLPLRREVHTSQVVRTDGGPVTITTDVVSTLMSIAPTASAP